MTSHLWHSSRDGEALAAYLHLRGFSSPELDAVRAHYRDALVRSWHDLTDPSRLRLVRAYYARAIRQAVSWAAIHEREQEIAA